MNQQFKNAISYLLFGIIGFTLGVSIIKAFAHFNSPAPYVEVDPAPHFKDTDSVAVIYTTSWCPYCKEAKVFLTLNNITFTEYDIETSNKKVKMLYESLDVEGVPQIIIGNKAISGFNKSLIVKELEQLGHSAN
ncbi:glutaredoxin family protein [Pseudoalteromonas sp. T1lg65]|uniref:glutaredoxin family protein n=1 Tax=Pseudoalteromonas sp. T1lg65 TaxID=2077101 RepID=UPI003F7936EC